MDIRATLDEKKNTEATYIWYFPFLTGHYENNTLRGEVHYDHLMNSLKY